MSMRIKKAGNVSLIGCSFSRNHGSGIELEDANDVLIIGGETSGNGGDGILSRNSQAHLFDVSSHENKGAGIKIVDREDAANAATKLISEANLPELVKAEVSAQIKKLKVSQGELERHSVYKDIISTLSDHLTIFATISPYLMLLIGG